jgi:hypothetical protein
MTATVLLRTLTILALVLMPFGVSHAQAAAAQATASSHELAPAHCAEMDEHGPGKPRPPAQDRSADCALACSALPCFAGLIDAPQMAPLAYHPLPLAAGSGVRPEAAIPPPRRS